MVMTPEKLSFCGSIVSCTAYSVGFASLGNCRAGGFSAAIETNGNNKNRIVVMRMRCILTLFFRMTVRFNPDCSIPCYIIVLTYVGISCSVIQEEYHEDEK